MSGFKIRFSSKVNNHIPVSCISDCLLGSYKQPCTDPLSFQIIFDIKPVQFRRILRVSVVSDTSDYSVFFIEGKPKFFSP